tara:strand:- start:69198 stop:70241 length:1044 start_codon:yes stop_codon:yes gene_type:complete
LISVSNKEKIFVDLKNLSDTIKPKHRNFGGNLKFIFALLLLSYSLKLFSSHVSSKYEQYNFNDELDLKHFHFTIEGQANDPLWNFPLEDKSKYSPQFIYSKKDFESKANQKTFSIENFGMGISKYFKNVFTQLRVTQSTLKNQSEQSNTKNFASLFLSHSLQSDYSYQIVFEQDFTSASIPSENNLEQNITQNTVLVNLFRRNSSSRSKLKLQHVSYSDSVEKKSVQANSSIPLLKSWISWFWFGYEFSHDESSTNSSNYYSPRRLQSHSLFFESSQDLQSIPVSISLAMSYGQSKEEELDWLESNGLYFDMSYGKRGHSEIKLVHSKFNSRSWNEDSTQLAISHSF